VNRTSENGDRFFIEMYNPCMGEYVNPRIRTMWSPTGRKNRENRPHPTGSATLLPRFSLALVGFLDVQSFQMSTQERCFVLIVRLEFQIAWYIS